VIMFSVFAAFVPEGEGPIKTIAFGLAVGVFVDAFLVRMTLVPAVLALLGDHAWRLPGWIDRRLPSFDVEGEGLAHQVSLQDWPRADDRHLVYAEGLALPGRDGRPGRPVDVAVLPHDVLVVQGPAGSGRSALLLTLAGRMRLTTGRAKVAGLVLPEQAAAVRRRTGFLDCAVLSGPDGDLQAELRAVLRARPDVVYVDHAERLSRPEDRSAIAGLVHEAAFGDAGQAVVIACEDADQVADLIGVSCSTVTLGAQPGLAASASSGRVG